MNSEFLGAFQQGSPAPIDITSLLINLLIGVLFSFAVSWHFRNYGSTLSNREELNKVFPLILLTTILIITVVKSSIALSLGLVGALSIVRFRTPVKEPEELGYLFLSIAIGIGLGASQTLPTIISGLLILIALGFIKRTKLNKLTNSKGIYLSIDWTKKNGEIPDNILIKLNEDILNHVQKCDLRRYDLRSTTLGATYLISTSSVEDLDRLSTTIRNKYPEIGLTFLDQNQFHGI